MKLISRILLSTLLLLLPGSVGAQFASSPLISAAPGFLPDTLSVKSQGATGNFQTFQSAVMTAGSATLTKNNGAPFTLADAAAHKPIIVTGALGTSSAPLVSTIQTYVSATQVTLADQATHATSNAFLSGTFDIDTTASSGNYVPGETLACTGGTTVAGANCIARIYTTKIATIVGVVNAGTGATSSPCFLSTTTGTGAPIIVRYATSAGSITGAATVIYPGSYFSNPTTLATAAMTDARSCGITGVILNLTTTVSTLSVDTIGEYNPTPSVAMTTAAGSTSGATGVTFVGGWTTTGQGGFGTDDTAAVKRAQDLMIANLAAGKKTVLYFPAGNYLINGGAAGATSLSLCETQACAYAGDGYGQTAITVGPSYVGTAAGSALFSWHNSWAGNDTPVTGGSTNFNGLSAGAFVRDIYIVGFTNSINDVTAIFFQGRTGGIDINNVSIAYIGSCLRAGILNGTTDTVANVQESNIYNLRCHLSGTTTLPAVHLTAQSTAAAPVAAPNNINILASNIFGSTKDSLVIDATGTATKSGGNIKISDTRVEGIVRRGVIGAGDLLRIGNSAATSITTMSSVSLSNVNLAVPIADTATPIYYCALRVASQYVSNVSGKNLIFSAGGGGSNAICIDGGSSIHLDIIKLTSALYDVSVASSTTVGAGIEINVLDDANINSPYRWSVDATSLPLIYSNVLSLNNSIKNVGVPTGNYSFNGTLTANTAGTFPTSGLFGSFAGTFTTTTAVTWPVSVNFIRIVAASQGGCGGGGGMQTLGTLVTGGGAGGGGIIFDRIYKRAELGNSTTFTIGTPCTPGAGALVIGNGAAGGTGGAAGAGASVAYTLANGTVVTAYGGGYGGASNATGSIGGGGAGFGGAGIANVAGSGVTFTNFMGGFGGGGGAVGASTSGNVGWQATGAGGGGASTTTGLRGGDSYICPGGGSGGTLLIASASVGGSGGSTPYQFAVPAGGAATGATGGAGVLHSFATGGSAPGGGGANAAGVGGTGGSAALVPCAGGSGGGSGTTRGGDAGAIAPPTVTYVAW